MSFIKKYWITEIGLGLLTLGGLGVAGYNVVGANNQANADQAPAEIINLAAENADNDIMAAQNATENDMLDEEDDEDIDEFAAGEDDEGESEDEEGEDEEGDEEDPLYIAAQALGLDAESFEEGLAQGKSMADIVTENGGDVQTFIDATIAAEMALVEAEIQSGEASAEDAAEWREEIIEWTPFMVNTPYQEPADIAAQALNMDEDTFWEAVESGQTVAALAEAQGIAPQTIIDAIQASEEAYLNAMVDAGLIEQEEINEVREEMASFANIIVNAPVSQWEAEEGVEINS